MTTIKQAKPATPLTAERALRELADGYFHDGIGGKFPLTELGKARREVVISEALQSTQHRLPHTLSEPRRSIAPHLRAMCTPSELAWLIKERDILLAERAELVAALRTAANCLGNDDEWWQTEGEGRFQNQIDNLNLPHPTAEVIRGQVADEARALLAKLGAE